MSCLNTGWYILIAKLQLPVLSSAFHLSYTHNYVNESHTSVGISNELCSLQMAQKLVSLLLKLSELGKPEYIGDRELTLKCSEVHNFGIAIL